MRRRITMLSSFKRTYVLPFKYDIPHYTQAYLDSTPLLKRLSKFIRRSIFLSLTSQSSLERFAITASDKNILWINMSAPSLGDSLMDLSSRVLLEGKHVDLFTDKKNAHIYKHDAIFENIYTSEDELQSREYDLIIIDSYSTRSLKIKINAFKTTPFVGMYGYYNGPEVNRVLYSFHQMNALLGYPKSEEEINSSAKASMQVSSADEEKVDALSLPSNYTAIVLGGEWDYRTFNQWAEVIENIISLDATTSLVFVGSNNATEVAEELKEKFKDYDIRSCVAQLSFNQTAEVIKRATVLLCCDGGLMHAANGVGTTIVPLFAHLTPQMQLTQAVKAYAMFDKKDVNNIPVSEVVSNYKSYLAEHA